MIIVAITAYGAIIGLVLAIALIIKKVPPAYGMMIGALLGGLIGGASIVQSISFMISGAAGMSSGILRIMAAGILAGFLIESGSADTIAKTIVRVLGRKYSLLAIILAAWVLQCVGTFGDVVVVIVAPIALDVARSTNCSKSSAAIALIGGIHAGNIISPNPNTINLSEGFNIPMTSVMLAGLIPSIAGIIFTYLFVLYLRNKMDFVEDDGAMLETTRSIEQLPPFALAIVGPVVTIMLLAMRAIIGITIDPLIALPMGGIVGAFAVGKPKQLFRFAEVGLSRMSGIVLLLIGTGTIAGIIGNSELSTAIVNAVNAAGLPGYILPPLVGITMGGATASTVSGTSVGVQVFGETILSYGIWPVGAAAMIHAGCCCFDCLPHGSFFHISAGTLKFSTKDRLKILPHESLIGWGMTIVATILYGTMGFTF